MIVASKPRLVLTAQFLWPLRGPEVPAALHRPTELLYITRSVSPQGECAPCGEFPVMQSQA